MTPTAWDSSNVWEAKGMTTLSKHDVRREHTRASLEEAAWDHFLRDGYEGTTVAAITESCGVTERTFFRHFDSKEAVLFGDWRSYLAILANEIMQAQTGQPILGVVEDAVVALAERYETDDERNVTRIRLMAESEAVASFERRVIHREWEDTIASAVTERLQVDINTDLRPHLVAGMAVAAVHAAAAIWQQEHEFTLAQYVAAAFTLLAVNDLGVTK
jgi:AcrR family transcriptional regulator